MYVFPVRDPDAYPLHQRPVSYWDPGAPETLAIGVGCDDGPPLVPSPAGIGEVGGYLPPLEHGEVQIVLQYFSSTLGNVTSLRARFDVRDGRIYYRMVNDAGWRYACKPDCSRLPLNMEEVIGLLDTVVYDVERRPDQDYFEQIWEEQFDRSAERYPTGFVTVSSPFYLELGKWYAEREEAWFEQARKVWEEDDEDVDEKEWRYW